MERIYIGTKIVAAEPMGEKQFISMYRRDQQMPKDIIERPGFKVRYEDGYVSWSPKETFERAYREITDEERRMLA